MKKTKKIQGYIIVTEEGEPMESLTLKGSQFVLFSVKLKHSRQIAKEMNSFPRNTSKVKVTRAEIIIK